MNRQEQRKTDDQDEKVKSRRDYNQRCGRRWMMKPDQQDVDQDSQENERDIDEDPTEHRFVDGWKIFRANKFP